MKKIFIGLVLSIALFFAAVYLFFPAKVKIEAAVPVRAPLPAVSRLLTNENSWSKWWPGDSVFLYNENEFRIQKFLFNTIDIRIRFQKDTTISHMELVLINSDSVLINWMAEQYSGRNPFKRFSAMSRARQTQQNMQFLLDRIKSFMERPEDIYGFVVRETIVIDSVLITTKKIFDHKPGVKEIDEMIQSLKKFIAYNNAEEKNYPMLNVTRIDSLYYEAMTAIPTDRSLPNTKEFTSKFMLKGGKLLETEVRGGPYTIENAFNAFENYRSDYKYKSPAIPYQLMITNRAQETDTTKWITKLYYPVL